MGKYGIRWEQGRGIYSMDGISKVAAIREAMEMAEKGAYDVVSVFWTKDNGQEKTFLHFYPSDF